MDNVLPQQNSEVIPEKRKVGRPRKKLDADIPATFKLPRSAIDSIKLIAKLNDVSQSEAIQEVLAFAIGHGFLTNIQERLVAKLNETTALANPQVKSEA